MEYIGCMARDNNLLLAIIAINMTVIGLTSLAESKNIVGIDYGKFLIRKYKVFHIVRIYYILIFFAIVNISSLLCLFVNNNVLRNINFIILLLSLMFAIYYFFSYILIENSNVKKQIFEQEFIGLYCKSNKKPSFDADLITNMNCGSRSERKISSNVITYFNIFNSETQKSFCDIFGPEAFVYYRSKRIKRLYQKKVKCDPYNYQDEDSGLFHISHEFFQLFRYSELQEKWLLEILRLFNDEYINEQNDMKLNNIIRVLAHINTFGFAENLYKYKFLEYISSYIIDSLSDVNCKNQHDIIVIKEKFLLKEYCKYILFTIEKYNDLCYIRTAEKVFMNILDFNFLLPKSEVIKILFENTKDFNSLQVKKFAVTIYNYYVEKSEESLSVTEIKNILKDNQSSQDNIKIKCEDLFG